MAGFPEHEVDAVEFHKSRLFLDHFSNYSLLKKDSSPCS
jgi:hypothetical protein